MTARPSRIALFLAISLSSWHASAADLTVSAAASLTNALKVLGPMFEARHPGTRVLLNFGASGALMQQMAKGAPVDVFASADQESMDQAQALSLIVSTERRNFASNALVVIVPIVGAFVPTNLQELAGQDVARVALGLPASVPAGRYAKAALDKAGLWATIERKVIGANNVRQALDYVARGEVDAGFVYRTDAALMPDKVKIAFTVRTETPVVYAMAPVHASPNAVAARQFVAFMLSAPAQAVLARQGFEKP